MTVVVAEIIRLLSDGHLAFSSLCSWIPGSRATPAPRNDDLILCQSLTERAHSERRKINRPRCAEAGSALKLPIKQVIGPFTQNWFDFRLTLRGLLPTGKGADLIRRAAREGEPAVSARGA